MKVYLVYIMTLICKLHNLYMELSEIAPALIVDNISTFGMALVFTSFGSATEIAQ